MTIVITRNERNALYGEIVVRLSGIDAFYRSIQAEDFEKAEQLAREYSDYMLFLLTDLGWGESSAAHARVFELTTDPQVVYRVMGRLRVAAATQHETDKTRTRAARADEEFSEFVMTICSEVLGQLDSDRSSSG